MRFNFKLLIIFSFLTVLFGFLPSNIKAKESQKSFISIVNPVRGEEFWPQKNTLPQTAVEGQTKILSQYNLPATWLLRFDALENKEILKIIKNRPSDELGIFLEITPRLAQTAKINYHQSLSWHNPESVLLIGYSPSERQKLIDSVFEKFKNVLGYYPKSVGSWWTDSFSIEYMQKKYKINAVLNVSDQFTTDNYQIWGQYWSSPFYPTKANALIPAQIQDNKLNIVITQWAPRDPFNGYGRSTQESTYSLQANDYLDYHNLNSDYFSKVMNIYLNPPNQQFGQVTVGLENDYDWTKYAQEYQKQMEIIFNKNQEGIQIVTMSQFATWYQNNFPNISPPRIILAEDPLGSGRKSLWYMSSYYRVGWFIDDKGSSIRDLRIYDNNQKEPCFEQACKALHSVVPALDDVAFGKRMIIDPGKISNLDFNFFTDRISIKYQTESGKERFLEFRPQDLTIDDRTVAISEVILKADKILTQEKNLETSSKFPILKNTNFSQTSLILRLILDSLIFLLLIIIFFYIPGRIILSSLSPKLTSFPQTILSLIAGMIVFTLLAWILGYFNLRFLSWPLIFLVAFYYYMNFKKYGFIQFRVTEIIAHKTLLVLILTGVLIQGTLLFRSGWLYDYGLGFWGANGHDATWHLALISELSKNFPPQNPTLAGFPLKSYHYFSDLLMAEIARLSKLDSLNLYFRFFPALFSLLYGTIVFILAEKWFKKKSSAILAVIFAYFAGSFGWVPTLWREHGLGGESMFWSFQSISLLLNPPLIFSFLMLLAGFYFLIDFLKNPDWKNGLLLVLFFGSMSEFKIYGSIIVLSAFAASSLFLWITQKSFKTILIFLITSLVAAIFFLPNNWNSSSLLIFQPWWFIQNVTSPDRLNWLRIDFARQAYQATHNWFKLLQVETLAFLIFLLGNLGMRFLGFGLFLKKPRLTAFNIFLISFLFISLLLPLLFVQKTSYWNTIQFFYYFLLIFNFLAAGFLSKLIENKNKIIQSLIILLIIILTIPTTISSFRMYFPDKAHARISSQELAGLNFLKNQPAGTVLVYPYDKYAKDKFEVPYPLFAYESTAYVAAFSAHRTYLEDEMSPDLNEEYFKKRLFSTREYFRTRDFIWAKNFIRENNINYIYVTAYQHFPVDEEKWGLKKIFENQEVKIYQAN